MYDFIRPREGYYIHIVAAIALYFNYTSPSEVSDVSYWNKSKIQDKFPRSRKKG